MFISEGILFSTMLWLFLQADGRSNQAGLGSSSSVKTNPNESYKDSVKRTLYSRYNDL